MSKAITIRNVPDEVVTELSVRAARSGRSLQEFLRTHLIDFAHTTDLEVWIKETRHQAATESMTLEREEILESTHADRR